MTAHLRLAGGSVTPAAEGSAIEIRVLVADDHELVRRGLRAVIEAEDGLELVGEANDVGAIIRELTGREPNVLVLDLSIPGGSSIETISGLREQAPATQIVVMTMSDSPAFAQRALAAGAIGYISKELADRELPTAIRAAARGEQYISPGVAAQLESLGAALTNNKLSPREVEVLRLISLGHTSVEVARMLHLSPRTVETHRAHIHRKLGVATRAELVRYALRRGLLGDR